jgi:hypothetical protein
MSAPAAARARACARPRMLQYPPPLLVALAAAAPASAAPHDGVRRRQTIPAATRRLVLWRQRGECADCGASLLGANDCFDIDHIAPLCVFPEGELLSANMRALCAGCHAWKTRKSGEARRIARFRAALLERHRVCWLCDRHVSPYFFRGCICSTCALQIEARHGA